MSDQPPSAPAQTPRADEKIGSSGHAITSLVLGIIGLIWSVLVNEEGDFFVRILATLISSLAIVFSISAFAEIRQPYGLIGGKGMAIAGFVLGLGPILLFLLHPLSERHRYEVMNRANCLSNLKQIGMAIAMYADSNGGRTPWDGTPAGGSPVGSFQLLSNFTDSARMLRCGSDGRRGAGWERNFAALTALNVSYSLVPGLNWQSGSPDSIIALDRTANCTKNSAFGGASMPDPNHNGVGGNVLFNDGHVEFLSTIPHTVKDQYGRPGILTP